MKTTILKTFADTEKLARHIAGELKGGEVIALIGDLGAGKTTFTKAFAATYGIDPSQVTSPTFVLMKEYLVAQNQKRGIKKIIHIDAYRLQDGQSLLDIGVADYFNDSTVVTIIEWADRVIDILPPDTIQLKFTITSALTRKVVVKKRPV